MGDDGEGEIKNLKKWVTSFLDDYFVITYYDYFVGTQFHIFYAQCGMVTWTLRVGG